MRYICAVLGAPDLTALEDAVADLPPDVAGIRLHGIAALYPFLTSPGPVWQAAAVLSDDDIQV